MLFLTFKRKSAYGELKLELKRLRNLQEAPGLCPLCSLNSCRYGNLGEELLGYHPDVAGKPDDSALTEKFISAKNAYDVLRDPDKRKEYDAKLRSEDADSKSRSERDKIYRDPFTYARKYQYQSPYDWVDRERYWRNYSEEDIKKIYKYIRKKSGSGGLGVSEEEYRRQAWNEVLRQREEYLRQRTEKTRAYNERTFRDTPFFYDSPKADKVATIFFLSFFITLVLNVVLAGGSSGESGDASDEESDESVDYHTRQINEFNRMMTRPP
ncbi:unnamed protein product [Enterobius vermicularis]|uniref:J domain-containing protein n=1 Tax=Enterobius vermicularis TaxID=51028 RepID=A0A0N4V4Q9_ENTVE|nr:unnamed protein product [Enterobius vermicularis]